MYYVCRGLSWKKNRVTYFLMPDSPNSMTKTLYKLYKQFKQGFKNRALTSLRNSEDNFAFLSSEQRVAVLQNHSPRKTANFSNMIRSIKER